MNYNNWLHTDEIEKLREIPHLADILDSKGYIRATNESKILSWHFGIVPWVVTEDIVSILAWFYPKTSLETNFKKTLKSGDRIGYFWWKGEPEIYIPGRAREIIIETSNVSWISLQKFPLPQEYEYQEIIPSLLSDHLLQSWDFQFVSGSQQIDTDGYFSGHYTIPKNHPFLTEKWFPFAFMKEVANQVVSLSASLHENPKGVKNGSSILLLNSHTSQDCIDDSERIIWWNSSILITGKAGKDPENPKRNVIAEYSAYCESIPLFHGIIRWIKVPTKILFR